jgi:hypothetical protein
MRARLMLLSIFLSTFYLIPGEGSAAEKLSTQSSSGSGVTVKTTPRAVSGGSWEFEVVFDTHSQDLSDDLMKTATLIADGRTHVPVGWKSDPPGGHHRKGVLRFNAISPAPKAIELRIARPGEPKPRLFRWELK